MHNNVQPTQALLRRAGAEFMGTGLLVTIVVGSGIAAQNYSRDTGLQLLENALATAAGLAVLILVFGPVSGGHFNPMVSIVDWLRRRRRGEGLGASECAIYVLAQLSGSVVGAIVANLMFDLPAATWSTTEREGLHLLLSEVVATAGLVLVILALSRTRGATVTAWAVGAYIGAAYWFTSSTSFANPAVTIGRMFTDTFAGITPGSVPGFVIAQLIGATLGLAITVFLYPDDVKRVDVVVPHEGTPA